MTQAFRKVLRDIWIIPDIAFYHNFEMATICACRCTVHSSATNQMISMIGNLLNLTNQVMSLIGNDTDMAPRRTESHLATSSLCDRSNCSHTVESLHTCMPW
jgi:hypothetical protein